MMLRLLHIDFDTRDAALAVYAQTRDEVVDPIPELLAAMEKHGIESVTLHSRGGEADRVSASAAMSRASGSVDVLVTSDDYTPLSSNELLNGAWSNQRQGEVMVARSSPTIYAMRFTDFDRALDRLTAAIQILGATGSMCRGSCNHLRFVSYELAGNTIEHARFDAAVPEIRIGIRPRSDGIQLSFRDNARPFDTRKLADINVGQKITRGERRGLGLFMLSRIADSLDYERVDGWNVTTMSVPDASSGEEIRRKSMSDINIMITPCSVDRTIVLRPVGTVDSATSGVLEAQIAELIKQDVNRIVVDMADVEFISSSGIGVFLGSVSGLRSRGGDLLFMNVPSHVEDVFDIVNLRNYFRTISNLDELQPTR
jgi:anti-sigma B factor antagonist